MHVATLSCEIFGSFFTQSHKGIVLGLLLLFLLCHIRAVDAVDLFCYFFLS